jgi:PIN domain nuclease of toxin-antitoxin system
MTLTSHFPTRKLRPGKAIRDWRASRADARQVLSKPTTGVLVSAASAWEIAIKSRLGRLDGDPLLSAWPDNIADMTAVDRVLVAQAARRNLTIATSDKQIIRAALSRP